MKKAWIIRTNPALNNVYIVYGDTKEEGLDYYYSELPEPVSETYTDDCDLTIEEPNSSDRNLYRDLIDER